MPDKIFERIKKALGKETEPIDKWINRFEPVAKERPEDISCWRFETITYFPLDCKKGETVNGKVREIDCEEAARAVKDAQMKAFGGGTCWPGEGWWYNRKTDRVEYDSRVQVCYSAHMCTPNKEALEFVKTLKDMGEKTAQFTVAVKGTNKFLIVPPELIE